jgi:hypothetical protein
MASNSGNIIRKMCSSCLRIIVMMRIEGYSVQSKSKIFSASIKLSM